MYSNGIVTKYTLKSNYFKVIYFKNNKKTSLHIGTFLIHTYVIFVVSLGPDFFSGSEYDACGLLIFMEIACMSMIYFV